MTTRRRRDAVALSFDQSWGRLVAGLIAWCGDWDLAEECAQEAFAAAVVAWERDGPPASPLAWLTTVARNRARDRLRRRTTESAKLDLAGADEPDEVAPADDEDIPDERLRLIFTCCHPALPMPARVALTLRTLCGLTPAEIARAFLVTEPTMEKRLVRVRAKIKHAGIPYRVPPPELWPERVEGVLGVLYLMFNEGYAASSGDSVLRVDVSAEAIRLTRSLVDLLPGEDEVGALLGADAAHRRPPAGPGARRARRTPGRAGPDAVEPRRRSPRAPLLLDGREPWGPVRRPGPDLALPRRGRPARGHRLGRDRAPLHPAPADAGDRAQPGRRGVDDPRAGGGAGDGRRTWPTTWPATTSTPPRGPTSRRGSAGSTRPRRRSGSRSTSRPPVPSGDSLRERLEALLSGG